MPAGAVLVTQPVRRVGSERGVATFGSTVPGLMLAGSGTVVAKEEPAEGASSPGARSPGGMDGAAVAAMHSVGMATWAVQGLVAWSGIVVGLSVGLSIAICAVAVLGPAAMPPAVCIPRAAAGLLVPAVLALHFTGMAALSITPLGPAGPEIAPGTEHARAPPRREHPTRGMIAPSVFIPLAEETGPIPALGTRVLRRACLEAAGWPHPWRVAVNISPLQLADTSLPDLVTEVLAETGLDPQRLAIELTETAIVEDQERALAIRRAVKALGLGIALGKSLSIPVLAGGVERQEQLAILIEEGCDEAQGFLLGRPSPEVAAGPRREQPIPELSEDALGRAA